VDDGNMLTRHVSTTAMTAAGTLLAATFRYILIYKNLSLNALGEYALVVTLIMFLQPLISGDVTMFLISKSPEWPLTRALGLLKTIMLFEVLANAVGAALLYVFLMFGLPIHRWLPVLGDTRLLFWIFPIIAATSLFGHIQFFLRGKLRLMTANLAQLAIALIYLILLSVAAHRGRLTLQVVLASWAFASVPPLVVVLLVLGRELRLSPPLDLKQIPEALRFSMPVLVADFGGNVVGYFDRLVIGHYMPAECLGLYGFAYNVINMAQVAARSVMDSLFNSYYLYAWKNRHDRFAEDLLRIYLRWACLMCGAVLIFLLCYGRAFILLVSRPAMLPGYPFVLLLWPLLILTLLTQVKSIYLSYITEVRSRLVWINSIVVPISIVIYFVMIRHYHLVGACIASVLNAGVTYAVMTRYAPEFQIGHMIRPLALPFGLTLLLSYGSNRLVSSAVQTISSNIVVVGMGGLLVCVMTLGIGCLVGLVDWRDPRTLSAGLTHVMQNT
jgi:O-antigen/teichoic acid export membrane protein